MRSFLVEASGNIAIILGMAALFVTAIAYVAWLQPTSATAGTPIDISGLWNTTLAGDTTGSCLDDITQTGTELVVFSDCGAIGSGTRAGSIDVDTGAFTVSGPFGGLDTEVVGVATAEGTFSGTWTADTFSGTFTGVKKPPTPTPCPAGKLPVAGGCGTPTPTITPTPTVTPHISFPGGVEVCIDAQMLGQEGLDPLWTHEQIGALVIGAGGIWSQANINLTWDGKITTVEDPNPPPLGPGSYGDIIDTFIHTGEFLFVGHNPNSAGNENCVRVFFIGRFVDIDGRQFVSPEGIVTLAEVDGIGPGHYVLMSRKARSNSQTFAHEMGHMLGLPHESSDETNLMHAGKLPGRINLTEEQMQTARDTALIISPPTAVGGVALDSGLAALPSTSTDAEGLRIYLAAGIVVALLLTLLAVGSRSWRSD